MDDQEIAALQVAAAEAIDAGTPIMEVLRDTIAKAMELATSRAGAEVAQVREANEGWRRFAWQQDEAIRQTREVLARAHQLETVEDLRGGIAEALGVEWPLGDTKPRPESENAG